MKSTMNLVTVYSA